MRRLLALTLTLILVRTASADLLFYDGFDYGVGSQLPGKTPTGISNSWNYIATGSPLGDPTLQLITDNNLSYSGLATSTGKSFEVARVKQSNISRITLPGGPYSVSSTNKEIYFSFLMDMTTWVTVPDATASTTASQQGDFIAGFTASSNGAMSAGSVYGEMVRVRRELIGGVQTNKYQIGIHKNNQNTASPPSTGNDFIQWLPTSYDINQTLLVVGEYQLNTSDLFDDTVRLWVNPTPGQPAPTADLTVTGGVDVSTGSGTVQSNVAAFWFRDGTNVLPGKVTLDELRVGTDFVSVTPGAAIPVLAGDYNNDGAVNAGDYVTWRRAMEGGSTILNETASPNVVDIADYNVWRANFGLPSSPGLGAGTSIPEPSSFALVLIGLSMMPKRARRNPLK